MATESAHASADEMNLSEGSVAEIDSYMAQLLARYKEVPKTQETAADVTDRRPSDQVNCRPEDEDIGDLADALSPRVCPPEHPRDLTAMRDLANQSARSAIARHSRQQLIGKAVSKLLFATVALVGAYLLWAMSAGRPKIFAMALGALLVFAYCAGRSVWWTAKIGRVLHARRVEDEKNQFPNHWP